ESVLLAESPGGPSFWHAFRIVRDVRSAERHLERKPLIPDSVVRPVWRGQRNSRATRPAGRRILGLPIAQANEPAWAIPDRRRHGAGGSEWVASGNRAGGGQLHNACRKQGRQKGARLMGLCRKP